MIITCNTYGVNTGSVHQKSKGFGVSGTYGIIRSKHTVSALMIRILSLRSPRIIQVDSMIVHHFTDNQIMGNLNLFQLCGSRCNLSFHGVNLSLYSGRFRRPCCSIGKSLINDRHHETFPCIGSSQQGTFSQKIILRIGIGKQHKQLAHSFF